MPVEHLTPTIEDHRRAIAEKAGLTILTANKDFNIIATITGQPVQTLAN